MTEHAATDRSHDISQPLAKLSADETLKAGSDQLRGTILTGLAEETTRAVPGTATSGAARSWKRRSPSWCASACRAACARPRSG